MKELTVLKRIVLMLALLLTVARADALEYTDVYYNETIMPEIDFMVATATR